MLPLPKRAVVNVNVDINEDTTTPAHNLMWHPTTSGLAVTGTGPGRTVGFGPRCADRYDTTLPRLDLAQFSSMVRYAE